MKGAYIDLNFSLHLKTLSHVLNIFCGKHIMKLLGFIQISTAQILTLLALNMTTIESCFHLVAFLVTFIEFLRTFCREKNAEYDNKRSSLSIIQLS